MKNHCGTICKGHHWSQEKYKPLIRLIDGLNLEFRNDNDVILVNIHICLIDGKRYKEIELKRGQDLGGGIIELDGEPEIKISEVEMTEDEFRQFEEDWTKLFES